MKLSPETMVEILQGAAKVFRLKDPSLETLDKTEAAKLRKAIYCRKATNPEIRPRNQYSTRCQIVKSEATTAMAWSRYVRPVYNLFIVHVQ
jgi:hypothetical protein